MKKLEQTSHEYWHEVLTTGGKTTIPRWTNNPVTGIDKHEAIIPIDLVVALRQLADELNVSFDAVLLTAHAKVLAALSSEQGVATGYVAETGGQPLPCRLQTESDSWRTLLLDTQRAQTALLSHKEFPVADLRRTLGLIEPPFETVFDPTGRGHELPADTVLWIGSAQQDGHHTLQLRYRTAVLDAESAARIAGYHLTALSLIAADPDADHGSQHYFRENIR